MLQRMPMPKPQEKETEQDYLARFMADAEMQKEYPDQDQRSAVALSQWKTEGMANAAGTCAVCGHGHDGGVCDDCNCAIFVAKNAGSDDKCTCGDAAGDHQYGTGACLSCSNCKMFKRATNLNDLKNQKVLKTPLVMNAGVAAARADDPEQPWPESFPFRFIEPGLVNYDDSGKGTVLVKKSTLDKMSQSLKNKPVINNEHRDVNPSDFKMGRADGIVTSVSYNAESGWYEGEMSVWDPDTKANIRNGFAVSCAYGVSDWGEPGVHNNIPYEAEVMDGEYQHLAIVPNPRYEGATIQMNNSKGGSKMKLNIWSWLKGDKPTLQNSVEMESDQAKVEIKPGQEVALTVLVNSYKAVEEKKAAAAAAAASTKLSDDQIVDVGGKKVTVAELRNSFLRNADDEEADKKKKDDEAKNAAEAKDKEEKEKAENAMKNEHDEKEKESDSDHAKNAVENCVKCSANKSNALANAASRRPGDAGKLALENEDPYLKNSIDAKIQRGLEQYGVPLVKK